METTSLKALAKKVLERKSPGNSGETRDKDSGNYQAASDPKTFPATVSVPSPDERDVFDERTAIMQDSGIPEDEAQTLAYHCVRPIPRTFVESCPHKTPPNGDCRRYTMKLYKPTMSLKQYCKEHRKWCYELTPRPF